MTQQSNPDQEPSGGEVTDWQGQRVEHDAQIADEAMEEAGGDEAEAERRFEERTAGEGG